jgi:hypothetical protein
MTDPIKLIKLTTGDSLITRIAVNEDAEYATLTEPMRIHKWMQQHEDGDGAYENATFGPWESFSNDQVFHIAKNKILTLTEPREDVIRYYHRIVEKCKSTPIDSFDDEPIENVTQLKEALDQMNEKLGITGEEEDVLEYFYNKDKITKH